VAVGSGVYGVGADGAATLALAAQRAANFSILVVIDALADEHRALTAVAVLHRIGETAQAAAQQGEFKLRHIADWGLHETWFGREVSLPAYRLQTAGIRRRTLEEP
jgi:hypothetical protein